MGTEQLGGAQMASLTELSRGSLPMDLTCREYEVVPELCSRTYSNMVDQGKRYLGSIRSNLRASLVSVSWKE